MPPLCANVLNEPAIQIRQIATFHNHRDISQRNIAMLRQPLAKTDVISVSYWAGTGSALTNNSLRGNMLRITENLENGKTIRLRLDGTVSVESIAELDEACARFRDRQLKMIILDMAGVDFMKDDAARKLVELQSDSLKIINCSPFIVTLLETLRKD
jgi:hypothetical protein